MANITPSWTAGAHSSEKLPGDGWFSFSVPRGVVGASVGIGTEDLSTAPGEPTHAFSFSSGSFSIVEGGVTVRGATQFSSSDVFAIVRVGNQIYYCRGDAGGTAAAEGVPFKLPGNIVHKSDLPCLSVPVLLDAALLSSGDKIVGATRVVQDAGDGFAAIQIGPLELSASTGAVAGASISFKPLGAVAGEGQGARLVLVPLQARAAEELFNGVWVSFPAFTCRAENLPTLQGVYASFRPMVVQASNLRAPEASVNVEMLPLDLAASESTHASVAVVLGPMRMFAIAAKQREYGVYFQGVLPAFTGGAAEEALDVVEDSFVLSDAVYYNSYAVLEDVIYASGDLLSGSASDWTVTDTVVLTTSLLFGGVQDIDEGVVFSDLPLVADSYLTVESVAFISTEVEASSASWVLADSSFVVMDAALPITLVDAEESLAVSDVLTLGGSADLNDEVIFGDELLGGSSAVLADVLTDTFVVSCETDAQTVSFPTLESRAVFGEQLLMKQPGLVAWVMNTDTGAVSWYDNWAFTSMATVGGKVFAAGPDGLHVLGGDLDGADQIDARVDYGYTEFGGYGQDGSPKMSEWRKRMVGLWFGYHSGGALAATVGAYGQLVPRDQYTYTMPARPAGHPRNNRITPGKGLSARYWRISVANTGGCAFEVHSVTAEVAESTRRL